MAIPQKSLGLDLLLLSFLLIAFTFGRLQLFDPDRERVLASRFKFDSFLLPRISLQEAFSNGIIHSKAY